MCYGHLTMVFLAAMLQQPRLPPTGQRQAIEVHIKWREVLAQKQNLLKILSKTTGHSVEKLDAVSPEAWPWGPGAVLSAHCCGLQACSVW